MKSKPRIFTRTQAAKGAATGPEVDVALGPLIRDLRRRKGMTLQELAAAMQRSVGFVSQIERGLSQPTVRDLNVISDCLGVSGNYFYAVASPAKSSWVTSSKGRRSLRYADGFVDRLVSPSLAMRLCVLETTIEPGADTGDPGIVEHFEQAVYVLSGELTMWANGEAVTLRPGDACQLDSGIPTRCANRGKTRARVLWIYC